MKNNSELQTDVRKGIKWGSLLNAIPIGVNVLIEKIRRKLANFWYKTDKWIVAEVLLCLKANCSVSNEKFTLISEDGWVSLEGEFIWNHGTEAAKNALHYLAGVRVVTNNIKIKSEN